METMLDIGRGHDDLQCIRGGRGVHCSVGIGEVSDFVGEPREWKRSFS